MFAVLSAAIVVGALVGLATGGRVAHLAGARVRAVGLLVLGAGLQTLVLDRVITIHGALVLAALLGAYVALAGFAVANLGRGGMGVILTGIALNAVPIAVNGGMPVEAGAIVRARIASPGELPLLDFGAKRHLAGGGDHLRLLDDRFPDWITHHVLSFGDLAIGVGVGAVASGMLHPATGRRRRRPRRAHAGGWRRRRPATGGRAPGGGTVVASAYTVRDGARAGVGSPAGGRDRRASG